MWRLLIRGDIYLGHGSQRIFGESNLVVHALALLRTVVSELSLSSLQPTLLQA